MATWFNLNLQESASPLMEQMILFHDHSLLIIFMITIMVAYVMTTLMFNSINNRFLMENQSIETIWTILPGMILIFIALPSIRLLYLLEEVNLPALTIKIIGHQWYWNYEYSDFKDLEFDSFMIPMNTLELNNFRALDVNNHTVVPFLTQMRLLITSADVIHSWAMPAMAIKVDANPGRLNQVSFLINRPGLFFGQCSEICGAVHSFMPIVVESVSKSSFVNWLKNN
uniref:Cytochrome c oxidase subunit 2 n=1 Tax=Prionoglaris stygia TaxID=1954335 RepID=A0A343QCC4_9NEOP|nr:cytochrome c oxidase subunit II [Prionoglaris stygia]ATU07071.1 cytochrome c oxidase subunit II [Prionoglaris stygia]